MKGARRERNADVKRGGEVNNKRTPSRLGEKVGGASEKLRPQLKHLSILKRRRIRKQKTQTRSVPRIEQMAVTSKKAKPFGQEAGARGGGRGFVRTKMRERDRMIGRTTDHLSLNRLRRKRGVSAWEGKRLKMFRARNEDGKMKKTKNVKNHKERRKFRFQKMRRGPRRGTPDGSKRRTEISARSG